MLFKFRYLQGFLDLSTGTLNRFPEYIDLRFSLRRLISRRVKNSKTPRPFLDGKRDAGQGKILIVIPKWHFPDLDWEAGQGIFLFELFQSAVEYYGKDCVYPAFIDENQDGWQNYLIETLNSGNFSRILIPIEGDPNDPHSWTLDLFLIELRKHWNGVFLGLLFDSVWKETLLRVDILTMIDSSIVIIAIDRNIDYLFGKRIRLLGPILFPISKMTIDLKFPAPNYEEFNTKYHEATIGFMGKLYPYRKRALDILASEGFNLIVNENRYDVTGRSYDEYISGIRRSIFSLNLSRANIRNLPQFKTRILESALSGSIILTDENIMISKYFVEKTDFIFFHTKSDMRAIMSRHYSKQELWDMILKAYNKGVNMAPSQFWKELGNI